MDSILDQSQISLLNAIGENLFICDENLQIIMINHCSNQFINRLSPYTGITRKDTYLGKSLCEFNHEAERSLREALETGLFPFETKITLFHKFIAEMTINKWQVSLGKQMYIITWKDITKYEEELHRGHALLEELYAPVIETILDNVILMPITGTLSRDRFDKIKEIALFESVKRQADYLIIDFTGMTTLDEDNITVELETICRSLELIGTTVIYSGLSAKFVSQIVKQGTSIPNETFATFRQAIRFTCKKNGYKLIHI